LTHPSGDVKKNHPAEDGGCSVAAVRNCNDIFVVGTLSFLFRALALIVLINDSLFAFQTAIEPDSESRQFAVEKTVDLFVPPYGRHHQRIKLGEVPNNSEGVITLKLRNRSGQPIVLGDEFTGCKCTEVTVSSPVVAPSSTEELKITFSTENEEDIKKVLALQLATKESGASGIRLTIEMNVAAVLAFEGSGATLELSELEKSKQVRIPITLSPPIDPQDINVSSSGALRVLESQIVKAKEPNSWSVAVTLEPGFEDGDSGSIRISHPKSGATDELYCAIRVSPDVRVIPGILRVTWDKDREVWRASAAIKISGQWLQANAPKRSNEQSSYADNTRRKIHYEVRANRVTDLRKLKLKYREIAPGTLKLEIEFDGDLDSPPELGEISFEVRIYRKTLWSVVSAILAGRK